MITILSAQKISATKIRLTTTEMVDTAGYNVKVSNIVTASGHLIDVAHDNADFTGLGIKPKVLSATAIDSSHIDIEFDHQMEDGPALAYWRNYTLSGTSDYDISSATLDADGVTVHVVLSHNMLNGSHTITVFSVPDYGNNPTDPDNNSANFSFTYTYPVRHMVMVPLTSYSEGSIIEVRGIGIPLIGVYPSINLKVDDVVVATWEINGNYNNWYIEQGLYYNYPGHVNVDQIKIELTNETSGFPDEVGLTYWALDPASTAIASNEYYNYTTYSARVLLTAPSVSPSQYNSLICDLGTVSADKALTAKARMKAPVGVQGKMELWVFPDPGALLSQATFDGTNDWIDAELSAVTPTGIHLQPELRLITNVPNAGGSYVDWTDIQVEQELIVNPDFSPTTSPWYLNGSSRVSLTQMSEPAGTFVRATLTGVPPQARYYLGMCYDSTNLVSVMFGGSPAASTYANDTWTWNDTLLSWTVVTPSGGTKPDARGRFSFAFDSTRAVCVLFGGASVTTNYDDTWEFNVATSTWTQVHAGGGGGVSNPDPRYAAACAFDSSRNRTVVFGGYQGLAYFDDLWEYNGAAATWAKIAPVTSAPSARYYSAMVFDASRNVFVLFGGLDATGRSNETWEYNGATATWTQISPVGGVKPTARSEHCMVFDSVRNVCILFAGQDGAVGGASNFLNDVWEYNGATSTWIQKSPSSSKPGVRVAFGMSYDSDTERMFMFSGFSATSGRLSDFWDYTPATVTWTSRVTVYPVDHFNSVCQNFGHVSPYLRISAKAKVRAPVGTVARIAVYAIPWAGALSTYVVHYGSGDWEDLEIVPMSTDSTYDDLLVRLVVYSPNVNGTYVDWKNVSVTKNLVQNSIFRPTTFLLSKLVIDGYCFVPKSSNVYSTGTWLPGDGHAVVPGYKESEILTNNGNFDFGAETDDDYIADADTRIDTYRKGNGTLTVTDEYGNRLSGVHVAVEQIEHEFKFGGVFQFIALWEYIPIYTEKVREYKRQFGSLFNLGVGGCFWNDTINPSNGVYNTSILDTYLSICDVYELTKKSVALMYTQFEPAWVHPLAPAAARAAQLTYINYLVSKYAGVIKIWEVADEASAYYTDSIQRYAPGLFAAYQYYGVENIIKDAFAAAKAADPTATLAINDYHIEECYYALIARCLAAGSTIDSVKIQSHMDADVWSNQQIWTVTNILGNIVPDVRFSEVSIFSGVPYTTGGVLRTNTLQSLTSWPTTAEGEDQQAIEAERFYKMVFSCPYVKEITWWNLTDWYAWYYETTPSATEIARGLLRSDMTSKPAYNALSNLIYGDWWTTTTGYTNANGEFTFRGFAGDYELSVSRPGYPTKIISVSLSTAGSSWSTSV